MHWHIPQEATFNNSASWLLAAADTIRRGKARGDLAEAIERGFQALDNLSSDLIGRRQQVRIVKAVVLQPENIEVDLVALGESIITEAAETFALRPLVPIGGRIAKNEIVKVRPLQRPFL